MSGAQSIATRRAYGVHRVCRVWARPRSSVYARRQAPRDCARGHRRGPVGAAPDAVVVGHIRRVLEASPFHGEGYRKVWAKLRVEGIRTSQERVRRPRLRHVDQMGPTAVSANGTHAETRGVRIADGSGDPVPRAPRPPSGTVGRSPKASFFAF